MTPVPQMGTDDGSGRNMVLFNQTKRELFTLSNGYKSWHRRLRSAWKVAPHKDEITLENLKHTKLFVIPGPREKFSTFEFENLKRFMESGGSVLVLLGEGGEGSFNTNINFLLEEYGIMVNNDAVVRSVYYKYFHPKEALVSNGVLNRAVSRAAGKYVPGMDDEDKDSGLNPIAQALQYVYPYGATLNVAKPSTAVLSTGSACIPVNRPVLGFYNSPLSQGKLAVLGSAHMFHDQYIDKEENGKVMDVIIRWLTSDEIELNAIDAEDPEISDYNMLPCIAKLADNLKNCLQEGEDFPTDFTQLFDMQLFKLNNSVLPKVLQAYEQMRVKHEPLTLIPPNFETPLPPLQPASIDDSSPVTQLLCCKAYRFHLPQVFPPEFRDLPGPPLELYDLDECFSSEKVRLAQITNKCNDSDLEYYVRECGEILGITPKLPKDCRNSKHILEHVLFQIVQFKKALVESDVNFR